MRGEIIYKVLDFLEDRSMDQIDFVRAFLKAGYGASIGKIEREIGLLDKNRNVYKHNRERKRQLQKYISRLKIQGFILQNPNQKIKLSAEGRKKLNLFKKREILDKDIYKKENGGRLIIISYDIPTAFNRERDLIREILKVLGFSMIHKSVWIGKVKLPEKFIRGLERLEILRFIEILEVTKQGTVKTL